jgi:hypothetical protein
MLTLVLLGIVVVCWAALPLLAALCERRTNHVGWSVLVGAGSLALLAAAVNARSSAAPLRFRIPLRFGVTSILSLPGSSRLSA